FSAIRSGAKLIDAIEIMTRRKISELPVTDESDQPVGMLDITDLLGLESQAIAGAGMDPNESSERLDSSAEDPSRDDEWPEGPTTLRIFGPLH
ncbi:MAG: CBS domain-containing protein, partial [Planctomycetota bacterium]